MLYCAKDSICQKKEGEGGIGLASHLFSFPQVFNKWSTIEAFGGKWYIAGYCEPF